MWFIFLYYVNIINLSANYQLINVKCTLIFLSDHFEDIPDTYIFVQMKRLKKICWIIDLYKKSIIAALTYKTYIYAKYTVYNTDRHMINSKDLKKYCPSSR